MHVRVWGGRLSAHARVWVRVGVRVGVRVWVRVRVGRLRPVVFPTRTSYLDAYKYRSACSRGIAMLSQAAMLLSFCEGWRC